MHRQDKSDDDDDDKYNNELCLFALWCWFFPSERDYDQIYIYESPNGHIVIDTLITSTEKKKSNADLQIKILRQRAWKTVCAHSNPKLQSQVFILSQTQMQVMHQKWIYYWDNYSLIPWCKISAWKVHNWNLSCNSVNPAGHWDKTSVCCWI